MQKAILFLLLFVVLGSTKALAQFAINEGFKNSTASNVIIGGPGGTSGTAYLTSGAGDPVGAGWLRLTTATANQRGFAYIDKSFPSTMGVLIDFEYKMWRNNGDGYNGADGIGVFLFNATVPFSIGGFGGSLGYAPKDEGSSPGLAGGYVGIGIDAYGNFANPTDGPKRGGPMGNGQVAERPNSIVLRGPTTTNNTDNIVNNVQPTNRYLAGRTIRTTDGTNFTYADIVSNTGDRNENAIDYNTQTATRPTDATYFRRMQIEIVRLDESGVYYKITVRWKKNIADADFTEIVSYTTTDVPPALLKLGFAAATGGGINIHEVRNLMVTTPGNLRVVKRANKDILRSVPAGTSANQITYTIEVTNDTNSEVANISFNDKITDINGTLLPVGATGFTIETISHSGFVSAALPTPSGLTTNEINGYLTLAANATGRITVTGSLNVVPTGNALINTAIATPAFDEDPNNNTAVINTPVYAEGIDLMIVKKQLSSSCVSATGSSPKVFEVRVANMGTQAAAYRRMGESGYAAQRIVVEKTVPAGCTYSDGGTSVTTNTGSSGTERWFREALPTFPQASDYVVKYVSRGPSSSVQSLAGYGNVLYSAVAPADDYPIKYTITPPTGVTFTDVATVVYRAATTNSTYNGNDIELTNYPGNQLNNTSSTAHYAPPAAPTTSQPIVYYCKDATAQPLVATASTGNFLKWYISQGGFSSDYPITPATNVAGTFKYYVSQVSGDCESATTEITVHIFDPTAGSLIGPSQPICPNASSTAVDNNGSGTRGSGLTGTPGTLSYRWESSTDQSTWTTINGATGADLANSGNLSSTTYFRRFTVITQGSVICESPASNVVSVSTTDPGSISGSWYRCTSGNIDADPFTNVNSGTTGSGYSYKWQRSPDGTNWTDIGSTNTATYDPPSTPTSLFYYRRGRKHSSCTTWVYTNVLIVKKVSGTPTSGTLNSQTICYNTSPTIITSATAPVGGTTGEEPLTFEWDYWTGSAWQNTGITTETLDPSLFGVTITSSARVRRRTRNYCGTYSGYTEAYIYVLSEFTASSGGTIGTTQTICNNTAVTISSSNGGSGGAMTPTSPYNGQSSAITYRWESAPGTTGGTWTTINGATGATYTTPTPLTSSMRYRRYRIATHGGRSCESPASNTVTITVKVPTMPGVIDTPQNNCNGTYGTLTGSNAIGDGTITYQWQYSAAGVTFGNATGTSTTANYTPSAAGYYRRVAFAGGTCSATSNTVQVYAPITASTGTITSGGNQTLCSGTTPTVIVGSAVTGSAGITITYLWQVSTSSGGPWSNAPGTYTGKDYQPQATIGTRYYQRSTIATPNTGGSCQSSPTTPVFVTVKTTPTAGSIGSDQTICYNTAPAMLTDELSGSDGDVYVWQSSTNGSSWTDIPTSNTATYTPGQLTQNTYFRRARKYTAAPVCEAATEPVLITVQNISASTFSGNQSICGGNPAQITGSLPTASGTISYRWESSTNNSTWTAAATPNTNQNYQPPTVTGTRYYRRVTISTLNNVACELAGNSVTVTIAAALNPGGISGGGTFCNTGGTPSYINSTNSGDGYIGGTEFFWQSSIDNGNNWTNISSNSNGYGPAAITQTTQYRRGIRYTSAPACEVYSNAVTYTVLNPVSAGTISGTQTICYNGIPSQLTGNVPTVLGSVSYKWQQSPNSGSGFYDANNTNGNTGQNYQPIALNSSMYYRRITYDTYNGVTCQGITNEILVTVQGQISPGNTNSNQNVCIGATPGLVTGTDANGSGGISYRWESSTTGTGGWLPAAGTNDQRDYQPGTVAGTLYYRRYAIVTQNNVPCEVLSNGTSSVVAQGITNAGAITSSNQSICYNIVPSEITASAATSTGPTSLSYRWEQSSDNVTWQNAAGSNSGINYTPQALTATTYFRRTVHINNACTAITSGVVQVLVQSQLTTGSIGNGQSLCINATPAQLTGGTSSAGTAAITYLWEEKTDSGSWGPATGTNTGQNYQPPALAQSMTYRRRTMATENGITCQGDSNTVYISIYASLDPGTITGGAVYCAATNPGATTSTSNGSGGGTNIVYAWQSSTNSGANWDIVSGATSNTFDPPNVTATIWYRRVIRNTVTTCEVYSNVLQYILQTETPGTIGGATTFCFSGGSTTITSVADGTAGAPGAVVTYRWQSAPGASGGSFTNVAGTDSTLNTGTLTSTTRYRRYTVSTVNGVACESVVSNVITVTVQTVTQGSFSANQSVCNGGSPSQITGTNSTVSGTRSYRWEVSTDNSSWAAVSPSATSQNYTPPGTVGTRYYRRVTISLQNTVTCESPGPAVQVTVQAAIVVGSFSASQSMCIGTNPATIIGGTSTGSGTIAYNWEVSSDGSTGWTTAPGTANQANYAPPPTVGILYYRRITTSTLDGAACTATGGNISVAIISVSEGSIGSAQSICAGSSPAGLTSTLDGTASAGAAVTYRWESSPNGTSGWTMVAGQTGPAYAPGTLGTSVYYRRIAIGTLSGTICESAPTASIYIQVKGCQLITNPMIYQRVKN